MDFTTLDFRFLFNLHFRRSAFPTLTGAGALRFFVETINTRIFHSFSFSLSLFLFFFLPIRTTDFTWRIVQSNYKQILPGSMQNKSNFPSLEYISSVIGRGYHSSVPGSVWSPFCIRHHLFLKINFYFKKLLLKYSSFLINF